MKKIFKKTAKRGFSFEKIFFSTGIAFSGIFSPSIVLALSGTFKENVGYLLQMIYQIIPILFGLSFIVFFWGLSKFILNAGNKTELEKGKSYIMWGILILFILISFRAIISFIAGELDFGDVSGIPQLKSSGSMDTNTLNGALSPKI
jgi:hypothetical protein